MWYERWYDRVRSMRPMRPTRRQRFRDFFRDRKVRIASAVGAVAGLMLGLRRWRATRGEMGAGSF